MSFALINPTNPWTNLKNFRKKDRELAILKHDHFEKLAILKCFCFILMKISPNLYAMRNITLYSVVFFIGSKLMWLVRDLDM